LPWDLGLTKGVDKIFSLKTGKVKAGLIVRTVSVRPRMVIIKPRCGEVKFATIGGGVKLDQLQKGVVLRAGEKNE